MAENSSLIPRSVELDFVRRELKPHQITWWKQLSMAAEMAQPIFIACVLYRTVTAPGKLQVSWRTWYIGGKTQSGEPLSLLQRNTRDLGPDDIFIEPFATTLMHREIHTANDDSRNHAGR
jgi:hypothetical protein